MGTYSLEEVTSDCWKTTQQYITHQRCICLDAPKGVHFNLFGGNWNNGSNAGLFYFNDNNLDNRNNNYAGRLAISLTHVRLAKSKQSQLAQLI